MERNNLSYKVFIISLTYFTMLFFIALICVTYSTCTTAYAFEDPNDPIGGGGLLIFPTNSTCSTPPYFNCLTFAGGLGSYGMMGISSSMSGMYGMYGISPFSSGTSAGSLIPSTNYPYGGMYGGMPGGMLGGLMGGLYGMYGGMMGGLYGGGSGSTTPTGNYPPYMGSPSGMMGMSGGMLGMYGGMLGLYGGGSGSTTPTGNYPPYMGSPSGMMGMYGGMLGMYGMYGGGLGIGRQGPSSIYNVGTGPAYPVYGRNLPTPPAPPAF